MSQEVYHIPALLGQSIDALDVHAGGIYVDATMGGCGHSRAIVARLSAAEEVAAGAAGRGHVYAFDRDIDAVERAMADSTLTDSGLFTVVYSNFKYISNFMRYHGVERVDGILADLGVSFHHFDDAERGFSFRYDAPLDMRMNARGGMTAAELLEESDEERLSGIFSLYGELKESRRIARAITAARAAGPIATTGRLLEVISPCINPRREKKETAQVFQALRIVVNDELGALSALLTQSLQLLRPGGRLAIITYHSLEDRLVKNFMRTGNIEGLETKDFYGRNLSPMKPLQSKPTVPDKAEVERNPRSRSAKLRAATRTVQPENTACHG